MHYHHHQSFFHRRATCLECTSRLCTVISLTTHLLGLHTSNMTPLDVTAHWTENCLSAPVVSRTIVTERANQVSITHTVSDKLLPDRTRPVVLQTGTRVSCCRERSGIEHHGFGLWTATRVVTRAAEVDHLYRGATGYRQPSRNLISRIRR